MHTATYSPEDNKLRLYPESRLDPETYTKVRANGFIWAPKQELFVAPMWTPYREDMLLEMCGEIGDEDTGLVERAEQRAERFENYGERRLAEAKSAQYRVSAIANNIPIGQPILIGHHSEKHARRDAAKIENGMRRAVKMWQESKYWSDRAQGAIRAAKYKERPDVRTRRIKGLEAEKRKREKEQSTAEKFVKAWSTPNLSYATAKSIANYDYCNQCYPLAKYPRNPPASQYEGMTGIWSALNDGIITTQQAAEIAISVHTRTIEHCKRWVEHLENRLSYEKAMLTAEGGTIADRTKPEKGGACRCWASPSGGWSKIIKVNKVSVSVLDNWGNGGRNFSRTIEFDKLKGVMTADDVKQARNDGRMIRESDIGFFLRETTTSEPAIKPEPKLEDKGFQNLKESLAAGVKVVTANQLFPTPADIANEMVGRLGVQPGMRVLEPSAGTGNLIKALPNIDPNGEIVVVEINPELCKLLEPLADQVICSDFFHCTTDQLGKFDRIIMNPPFSYGDDIRHIIHASQFLAPHGVLVSLCANGPKQKKELGGAGEWIELPEGSFKSEGTNVNVAILIMRVGWDS